MPQNMTQFDEIFDQKESMNTLQAVTLFTSGVMLWSYFKARLADAILPSIMGCLYAHENPISNPLGALEVDFIFFPLQESFRSRFWRPWKTTYKYN